MIEIKKQKNIAILGSTGSIGLQTLDVVRSHPELFTVKAIAAYSNDELMEKQLMEFNPELAVLVDEAAADRLRQRVGGKYKGKRRYYRAVKVLLRRQPLAVLIQSLRP